MNNVDSAINNLDELGLTPDEAEMYLVLWRSGSMTAREIGERLDVVANSVYRLAGKLEERGFVVGLRTSPKSYQAVSPSIAVRGLVQSRAQELAQSSEELIEQLTRPNETQIATIDVLTGRAAIFNAFVECARVAEKEILVISVGENVPEEIFNVTQEAISRGATNKYIFQKHTRANDILYKRWKAMGIEVRHLPGSGYHYNIIDGRFAILSASNPNKTQERTGVLINNPALVESIRMHFYQQWSLAKAPRAFKKESS